MTVLKLQPRDSMFSYKGNSIELKNFQRNSFTGVWTFDLYYPDGSLMGVPVSTGTNVLKGNGTPFFKFIFLDDVSNNGDVTSPSNTKLYLLEE